MRSYLPGSVRKIFLSVVESLAPAERPRSLNGIFFLETIVIPCHHFVRLVRTVGFYILERYVLYLAYCRSLGTPTIPYSVAMYLFAFITTLPYSFRKIYRSCRKSACKAFRNAPNRSCRRNRVRMYDPKYTAVAVYPFQAR